MTTAGTRDLVKRLTKVLCLPMANDTTRERWLELALADMPWLRGKLDTSGTPEEATSAILLGLLAHQGEAGRRAVLNLLEEYGERQSTVSAPDAAMGGEAETLAALRAAVVAFDPSLVWERADAPDRPLPEVLTALRAAVRDEGPAVVLSPEMLRQVTRHQARDLAEYRLCRVAEWSQEKLDKRFTRLTLMVDQGPDAQGPRWDRRKEYRDVRDVLAEVPDTALVLLGAPGSGKTTLLQRCELDWATGAVERPDGETPEEPVTFFVSLNRYKPAKVDARRYEPAPLAWLERTWESRHPDLPSLDELLRHGRLVLLLDALNEIPHADDVEYRALLALWKDFVHEVHNLAGDHRVLFSCRRLDYSADLSSQELPVPQVMVEPLTDEQMPQFIARYSRHSPAAAWESVKASEHKEMLRSPYFLRLLVEQVDAGGEIPEGRVGLFTGFIRQALRIERGRDESSLKAGQLLDTLDCRKADNKTWKTAFDLPERGPLFPALSRLAYDMQLARLTDDRAQVAASFDEALALLEQALAPEHQPLAEEILHAGAALRVLDDRYLDEDEVKFVHQLMQEYFAARQLARAPKLELVRMAWQADLVPESLADTLARIAEADALPALPVTGWEETVVLAAAMVDDPDAFVADVADARLPLAARCATEPDVKVSDEVTDWLRQALVTRSQDPAADLRARIEAGDALGLVGDPRFERRSGPHGDYLLPRTVAIPAGRYTIGAEDGWPDERPVHEVDLTAFEIGIFPVTNAEYAFFIAGGGYEDERWWETADARAWLQGDESVVEASRAERRAYHATLPKTDEEFRQWCAVRPNLTPSSIEWAECFRNLDAEALENQLAVWYPVGQRQSAPAIWTNPDFNGPSRPAVGISWYEARAYCAWLAAQSGSDFRLPSEVQIEAATRGSVSRRYAYGDDHDTARCNTYETHIRRTTPVGVFADGATPEGIHDLTGNVWEWTCSLWGARAEAPDYQYPYDPHDGRESADAPPDVWRVVRGGSWLYDLGRARAACRVRDRPDDWGSGLGFRVVLLVPPISRDR